MNEEGSRLSDQEQVLPVIDREICTACQDCLKGCPLGALGVVGGEVAVIHPELCTYCGDCEGACPKDCIGLPLEVVFLDHLHDGSGLRGK